MGDTTAFLSALTDRAIAHEAFEGANVGNFRRSALARVRPADRPQARAVVEEANRHRVPLYPLSRGSNWGYGSHLPAREGCVVLDLSGLDRIVSIDADQGVATIEPGVTQAQLAEAVARQAPLFALDVTGSGPDTSVLGNALERGIAYHGLRATQLVALEVLLGDQSLLRTGFGHFPRPALAALYPFGLGPSLDGLFFQSNLGIVLEGTIQLLPRPETIHTLSVSVSEDKLPELITRLRALKRQGCLQGIPHVGDRERTVSTLAPLLRAQSGDTLSLADARAQVARALPADWTVTASLQGERRSTLARKRVVAQALRPLGRTFFHSETDPDPRGWLIEKLVTLLAGPDLRSILKASAPLRGLHYGRPTSAGVAFLTSSGAAGVDEGSEGFLLCTPLAPLRSESAAIFRNTARMVAARHGLRTGMTLNLLSDRVLEAVISIHFMRADEAQTRAAHACLQELTRSFNELGFYPYRINIDQMKELIPRTDPYWQALARIRDSLDPNGIIAPGRYE